MVRPIAGQLDIGPIAIVRPIAEQLDYSPTTIRPITEQLDLGPINIAYTSTLPYIG